MGGWGSRVLNLWKCENTRFLRNFWVGVKSPKLDISAMWVLNPSGGWVGSAVQDFFLKKVDFFYAFPNWNVVVDQVWLGQCCFTFSKCFPYSEKESIVSQRNLEKPGDLWKLVFQKRSRIRWVRAISRSVCQLKNLQNARRLSIWTEDNGHCWRWSASWFTANIWSWITTVENTPPLQGVPKKITLLEIYKIRSMWYFRTSLDQQLVLSGQSGSKQNTQL